MPSSRVNEGDDGRRQGAGGRVTAPEEPGRQAEPQSEADVQPAAPADDERRRAEDARAAELARTEDRLKRALADLDNYRKRSVREIERRVGDARETLLREWLEAVDSVERALRMAPDDLGMRSVLDQMEAVLARHGVRRTGRAGERFDPELHEAIGVRDTDDVPDRTIVEVARSGFLIGDRVLRPAQVVVSRRPAPAA
jgi:molecular chaperone GrpE